MSSSSSLGTMDPRLQAKYLDMRQKLTDVNFGGSFGIE